MEMQGGNCCCVFACFGDGLQRSFHLWMQRLWAAQELQDASAARSEGAELAQPCRKANPAFTAGRSHVPLLLSILSMPRAGADMC